MTVYERVWTLFVILGMGVGLLLLLGLLDGMYLYAVTKEHPLSNRIIGLPASNLFLDSAKAQMETRGLVVYAKESMLFKTPSK